MGSDQASRALAVVRKTGLTRPRDLSAAGIPTWALYELLKVGAINQIGRGLYCTPDYSPSEHFSYAEVLKRTPQGILCLVSALRFHELTVQNPHEVWIAIPRTAWRPRSPGVNLHVCRFSGAGLTDGVETQVIDGVSFRVTTVPRTVADCFKYRSKVGLDVALEALQEGWRKRRFSMDEFWHYAKLDRVTRIVMPYLETLSS